MQSIQKELVKLEERGRVDLKLGVGNPHSLMHGE